MKEVQDIVSAVLFSDNASFITERDLARRRWPVGHCWNRATA